MQIYIWIATKGIKYDYELAIYSAQPILNEAILILRATCILASKLTKIILWHSHTYITDENFNTYVVEI